MQKEEIAQLLYSRKPYRIISNFISELPVVELTSEVLQWHRNQEESHPYREILVVLTGSVTQQLNNNFYHVLPNCILFIDSSEHHTLEYSQVSSGVNCWLVLRSGELFWKFVECENGSYSYLRRGILPQKTLFSALEECWNSFSKEMTELDKSALLSELQGVLSLILTNIGRQLTEPQSSLRQANETIARVAIQQVVAHVQNFCDCTVTDMARLAGYSPVHFARLFHHFTGMRPKEYINLIRKKKYAEMQGAVPVKQLAEILGFGSSAALAHWVKQNHLN